MATLILRLEGPMQSWGLQSRFSERDTGLEPSKSGVVGLLCAALGRPRSESLADLAALSLGVRVDREGTHRMDWQTAGGTHLKGDPYGVVTADGSGKGTVISRRHYLADASFLVGLEGADEGFLRRLGAALLAPVWPIFLGRKGYLPSAPVCTPGTPPGLPGVAGAPGLTAYGLAEVLQCSPWPARTPRERRTAFADIAKAREAGAPWRLRLALDAPYGSEADVRRDVPVSFEKRLFDLRCVRTEWVELTPEMVEEASSCTSRD